MPAKTIQRPADMPTACARWNASPVPYATSELRAARRAERRTGCRTRSWPGFIRHVTGGICTWPNGCFRRSYGTAAIWIPWWRRTSGLGFCSIRSNDRSAVKSTTPGGLRSGRFARFLVVAQGCGFLCRQHNGTRHGAADLGAAGTDHHPRKSAAPPADCDAYAASLVARRSALSHANPSTRSARASNAARCS